MKSNTLCCPGRNRVTGPQFPWTTSCSLVTLLSGNSFIFCATNFYIVYQSTSGMPCLCFSYYIYTTLPDTLNQLANLESAEMSSEVHSYTLYPVLPFVQSIHYSLSNTRPTTDLITHHWQIKEIVRLFLRRCGDQHISDQTFGTRGAL